MRRTRGETSEMILELLRSEAPYQRVLDIAFFILVPLVLALTMALVGRYVDALGLTGGILYVAALSFLPWWLAGIMTQLAHRLLSRRARPLWVIASLGVAASVPFVALYSHLVAIAFQAGWPSGHLLADPSWANWTDRVRDVLLSAGRAVVLWTAFVLVFAGTLGWSRFGYDEPDARSERAVPGRLQNSGVPWTGEDDRALAMLVADGLPPKAIAARMRRTVGAIRSRMKRLDLAPPSGQSRTL
jgi:hypothetical protein